MDAPCGQYVARERGINARAESRRPWRPGRAARKPRCSRMPAAWMSTFMPSGPCEPGDLPERARSHPKTDQSTGRDERRALATQGDTSWGRRRRITLDPDRVLPDPDGRHRPASYLRKHRPHPALGPDPRSPAPAQLSSRDRLRALGSTYRARAVFAGLPVRPRPHSALGCRSRIPAARCGAPGEPAKPAASPLRPEATAVVHALDLALAGAGGPRRRAAAPARPDQKSAAGTGASPRRRSRRRRILPTIKRHSSPPCRGRQRATWQKSAGPRPVSRPPLRRASSGAENRWHAGQRTRIAPCPAAAATRPRPRRPTQSEKPAASSPGRTGYPAAARSAR